MAFFEVLSDILKVVEKAEELHDKHVQKETEKTYYLNKTLNAKAPWLTEEENRKYFWGEKD